jgi:hypothetical protein
MARLWLEIDPGNTGPWSWPAAPATSWSSSCRGWIAKDPDRDQWHGCLIFAHTLEALREP